MIIAMGTMDCDPTRVAEVEAGTRNLVAETTHMKSSHPGRFMAAFGSLIRGAGVKTFEVSGELAVGK